MSCIHDARLKGVRSGLSKATAFSLKMMIDKVEKTGSFDVKIFQRGKAIVSTLMKDVATILQEVSSSVLGTYSFPNGNIPNFRHSCQHVP